MQTLFKSEVEFEELKGRRNNITDGKTIHKIL